MPQIRQAQELRRVNFELHSKMNALLTLAAGEDRGMTPEEVTAWDAMDAEYLTRQTDITRHETLEGRERDMTALEERTTGRENAGGAPAVEDTRSPEFIQELDKQRRALRAFIGSAPGEWTEETRTIIRENQANAPAEARAMGHAFVLPGRRNIAKGQYGQRVLTAAANATVAEEFMRELDVALLSHSGIAQAARIINTTTGADMPWPTITEPSAETPHASFKVQPVRSRP